VSTEEKRRQEAIYEILSSERVYLKKCKVVIDKYVVPMKAQKIVEPAVHACIFSEIKEVYQSGLEFLEKLNQRQKDDNFVIQNVGELCLFLSTLVLEGKGGEP